MNENEGFYSDIILEVSDDVQDNRPQRTTCSTQNITSFLRLIPLKIFKHAYMQKFNMRKNRTGKS